MQSMGTRNDEDVTDAASRLTDDTFLNDLRQQMIKFAILQLRDKDMAEDAVQEALIGALKNVKSFDGRAALKTWVFAILKNKIIDILRQKKRLINVSDLLHEDGEDRDILSLFDQKGMWRLDERPADWGDPEDALRGKDFWRVFEACLEGLPPKQARVFMMREFIELETDEICATVEITVTNLNVMLHRARLRLRECLENKWYMQGAV
ncbi:MAG: RNA polymerase factor sigma-70 [Pseudomonadota bacterium]